MTSQIDTAMIMCAGLGTRMGSLSQVCPKPLLPLATEGRTILDHILDDLEKAAFKRVVVNTHHLGTHIQEHLNTFWKSRFEIYASPEKNLLGTGGGIRQALPLLGKSPFFVMASDCLFDPPGGQIFHQMREQWKTHKDPQALLALIPQKQTWGTQSKGDFLLTADKKIAWPTRSEEAPYVYGCVQILDPAHVQKVDPGVFHTRVFWDKACANDALYGSVWNQRWLHVGTRESYETFLKNQKR